MLLLNTIISTSMKKLLFILLIIPLVGLSQTTTPVDKLYAKTWLKTPLLLTGTDTLAYGHRLIADSIRLNGVWSSTFGSSQWTTSGSNIYYNTGNVGIGNTNPLTNKLYVNGRTRIDLATNEFFTIFDVNLDDTALTYRDSYFNIDPGNQGINVGLGKRFASYKLDVYGDVNIKSGSKYKINGVNLNSTDIGINSAKLFFQKDIDTVSAAYDGILVADHGVLNSITNNYLNWNNAYTYRLTSASGTSPLTLTLSSNALTGSIANAAADGSTKGVASFASDDFDASAGNISLESTVVKTDQANTFGNYNQTFPSAYLLATRPKITTSIDDANGNELFKLTATGSAVNEFTIANAASGGHPSITASGSGTDININLIPKGAGVLQRNGVTMLDQTNTLSGIENKTFNYLKFGAGSYYYNVVSSSIAANRNITLPDLTENDEFTFNNHTQTLTNKTLTAPKFANLGYIADINGNEVLKFSTYSSAVNEVQISNSPTGGVLTLQTTGDDSNISLRLMPKGTGRIIAGLTTNMGFDLYAGDGSVNRYVFAGSAIAANRTVTLPLLTGNDEFVFKDFTQTFTNKTINLSNNTLSGTTAQFNAALSDGDFSTLAGSETLTNKTLTSPIINTQVTTASSSINLWNTTATTINFGGAATTLNIGASTGTTTIGNRLVTDASTTTQAGINIPSGTAPSSPVNGDVWTNASGYYTRINGATYNLLTGGSLSATTESNKTFFGINAGRVSTGAANTMIGESAGYTNSTGGYNTYLGMSAGYSNNNNNCVAVGYYAGQAMTGTDNTVIGYLAGSSFTNKNYNTILGSYAGISASGSNNVFIGYQAGRYETGDSKLFIDNQNRTNEATARTNSLVYGIFNSSVASQSLRVNGDFTYEFRHAAAYGEGLSYTPNLTQNVYTKLTPTLTTIEADGITVAGDSITIVTPGDYYVQVTCGFHGSANDDFAIKLYKNGATTTSRSRVAGMGSNNDVQINYFWYVKDLVAGDDLCFRMTNLDSNNDPTITDFKFYIRKEPEN